MSVTEQLRAAAKLLKVMMSYLSADCRHGTADSGDAKHSDRHDEAGDLDDRHPVRKERPKHRTQ